MLSTSWVFWALLSAVFAALTALCAKIGVNNIDSDLATFIRTLVILGVLGMILLITGKFHETRGFNMRGCLFLLLSGLATGASWLCYFRALKLGDAARVAPLDKLSVVFVAILGVTVLGEQLSLKGWLGVLFIGLGAILVSLG
ncbi:MULTISPECIES: EamA family transporter [Acetobacteraceae]|uniref:EamA family transporter n=1 Tax=Acetobacteraceae TaxID=433 RepID=UPI0013170C2C|nr:MULTISPECIES: EamA family transporter [Acetobacteraceae]MCL1510971.1 EamA family transporter [Parasaccharibacter sp. TMW 2.1884]MCQ0041641.1 EamA family transporter [Bombella sp.]QGT74786.1 EamA family transporter [Bombella sp. ESL0368]